MHRALQTEDIIYTVLEYLRPSGTDLVNVAMTCRTLGELALDMIWFEQRSLIPLILCLPRDTWEITEDRTINFLREPTLTEWGRLEKNASRVCRLIMDPSFPLQLHASPHVLQRLFERFSPTKLFPKLCALDVGPMLDPVDCSTRFLLLRRFLSSKLEGLRFDIPGGILTDEAEQFFDALPAEAYGLRQLTLSASCGTTPSQVLPSLGKLPKLMKLTIHGIDVSLTRAIVTNIQQVWGLQTLILHLYGTYCDEGGMPLELHGLKILALFGRSLPLCTHFLRQVTTRQLSSIYISYEEHACPTKIIAFIESLSTSQTSGSLEHIEAFDLSYAHHDDVFIPLPSEIFRPLLRFNRLSSVQLVDIGNYILDDSFIEDVAVSWPNIRCLRFNSRRRATCTVTFAAMMSLASKCRSLHILDLTVDATQSTTTPRAADGTEELWPTQTVLQYLDFRHSEVSEVARVPYLLAEVFPNVSDFAWADNFEYSETDAALKSALVKALSQLRKLRNLPGLDDTYSDEELDEDDEEWDEDDEDDEDDI
ncbi:hypothetical protein BDR04DRAFT_1152895 [Suillus decipiens]|nr:hypothetical protein BDR04DRAFT_1152895 [Suillus decipiens]